jgi:hypothetical protein
MTHATSFTDKSAFERAVNNCLYDKRVKSYFDRGHVAFPQVKQLLAQSDLFGQATDLRSYAAYSTLQGELAERSRERSDIINDPATIRTAIGLGISVVSAFLFLFVLGAINELILLASALCSGSAGYLLARLRKLDRHGSAYFTAPVLLLLAQSIVGARLPVIVAIDEIDRIGSLEQAEAFIGDIKTIFGVEKCYFLVAVAEDVGSLFAQRATAGRSILENAFDEIVAARPLELEEARDLLLKRVPGFTDAFAYLVYALSGGLPRELIRITRRLVEINLDQTDAGRYPRRLPDLALSLAKEGMIETLDASRNQLSRLGLQAGWALCFDNIRSVSIILRSKSSDPDKLYRVMEDISRLSPPKRNECADDTSMSPEDVDAGLRIISRLSAYAYFSVTIVDAFSDSNFDLTEAKRRTVAGIDGSYEQLAVARVELSAFADSARMILDRFRDSLSLGRISSR